MEIKNNAIITDDNETHRVSFERIRYDNKVGIYIRLILIDKATPLIHIKEWKEEDFWEMIHALENLPFK